MFLQLLFYLTAMQNLSTHEPLIAMPQVADFSSLASGELSSVPAPAVTASPALPPPAIDVSGEMALAPILVADDDPDDRFFIRRLIASKRC